MKNPLTIIVTLAIAVMLPISASAARPKAKKKPARPSSTEILQQAQTAFDTYDFDRALEIIDDFESDGELSPELGNLRDRAQIGSTMLSRVEHIAIIDSLTVDRKNFFDNYVLSSPAGYLTSIDELPKGFAPDDSTTVYFTESGESMIWSRPTANGKNRELVESHLLADGSWEQPQPLGKALSGIFANYPFLQPDGTTLYFAAKGPESLGGYDIFISRNDGDEYLQPQNIGMPYNSPYDDYLLAIDEMTGAGWWATDRNRIDGKLTIYIFVPQDLRINYAVDDPQLAKRAFITSIAATRDPKRDYSPIITAIENIDAEGASASPDFQLAVPGRGILTDYEQLRSADSRRLMESRLDCLDEIAETKVSLDQMRRDYKSDRTLGPKILDAEKRLDILRAKARTLTNDIVRLESR